MVADRLIHDNDEDDVVFVQHLATRRGTSGTASRITSRPCMFG